MKLSKWMSLMALLAAVAFACPPHARAQANDPDQKPRWEHRRPDADEILKRWTTELNLTDEQKEKIKPILADQFKKLSDLREDSSLSREEKFSKMHDIRQDSDAKIKAVLTPEQVKKFDEMREQARAGMRHRHGKGEAPPQEN